MENLVVKDPKLLNEIIELLGMFGKERFEDVRALYTATYPFFFLALQIHPNKKNKFYLFQIYSIIQIK